MKAVFAVQKISPVITISFIMHYYLDTYFFSYPWLLLLLHDCSFDKKKTIYLMKLAFEAFRYDMAGWCISRKHKQTVNSCVWVYMRVECRFIGNTSLAPDVLMCLSWSFVKSLMRLTAFVLTSWCMSSSVLLSAFPVA